MAPCLLFPSAMRSSFVVCVLAWSLATAACGSAGHGADAGPAVPSAPVPTAALDLAAAERALATLVHAMPAAPATPVAPSFTTESVYGEDVHSVHFTRATLLRKAPEMSADKVGIIGKDAHAGLQAIAPAGHGCATRWLELAPRGWTCDTAIEPSAEPPTAPAAPALDDDDDDAQPMVPGVYGAVRGHGVTAFTSRADALAGEHPRVMTGATSVRARGMTRVDGKRFWITTGGELIDASAIATISPSRFRGVALDASLALPLAWVHGKAGPRAPIAVRAEPSATAAIVGELPARTVVSLVEPSAQDATGAATGATTTQTTASAFVRIADTGQLAGWVARADLRIAARSAPPPGTAASEKWFDVDLDQQVLVAYEGARPVYATLVSTGRWDHKTPSSIARVVAKLESATMTSDKRELYSVADVPWTMYYDHDFALHTAYWHDGFGDPRSHGCVNLAPRDARLLYHWSSPDVPPGWTAVYGDTDTPGSLVRVRSRQTPDPAFRGYARTMVATAS